MENTKNIVNKHNARILDKDKINNNESYCNCRNKESCPLPGNCMISNIIHKAEISQANSTEKKLYIGMTAHPFKQRYNNHTKSFRDHKYSNKTVLSNYVWGLKTKEKISQWTGQF